jgi:hypothetical protein
MIKQLLISMAAVAPLLAQIPPAGSAFQQEGWLRFPDPNGAKSTRSGIDGQSGPVLGRPLSASEVRHTEQVLSDGSRTNSSETEHFYRDSMGRMRTENSTGAVLYDPVAGYICDLNSGRKTYTKIPIRADSVVTIAAAANHWSSSSSSGQSKQKPGGPVTEELAPQFLNGVYAKGARVTTTIPAGTIGNDHDLKVVNERWYSDDLKLLLKSSNSDPRFGVTTYELTDISQSLPDPVLFQIPADYTQGGH